MGRDSNIQALRGLAAMLVVVLHSQNLLDRRLVPSLIVVRLVPNTQFGAMGVDLFFVISGAVMAMTIARDPAPGAFLKARFLRVAPLFWIAAVATVAVRIALHNVLLARALLNTLTILPIFDQGPVYTVPVPGVGWTLAFELYFYLLVGFALLLPKALRADVIAGVLLSGTAAGVMIGTITTPMLGVVCNPILMEFLLGFWAIRAAQTDLVRARGGLIACAGGLLLLAGGLYGFPFSSAPEAVVAGQTSMSRVLAWGLPSAMLVIGVIGRPASGGRLLERLGDASYAIYLIHTALFMLIAAAWRWWGPAGSDLLFFTLIASAAFAGLGAHRWIEQPLLRALRGSRPQRARPIAAAPLSA